MRLCIWGRWTKRLSKLLEQPGIFVSSTLSPKQIYGNISKIWSILKNNILKNTFNVKEMEIWCINLQMGETVPLLATRNMAKDNILNINALQSQWFKQRIGVQTIKSSNPFLASITSWISMLFKLLKPSNVGGSFSKQLLNSFMNNILTRKQTRRNIVDTPFPDINYQLLNRASWQIKNPSINITGGLKMFMRKLELVYWANVK